MTRHRHHIPNLALAHRAATPLLVAASLLILASANVQAQTSPARDPLAASADMPMEDYLGLLRQIAPAAELGARQYLAAVRLRCGRTLATQELRLALGQDGGNPQLLALIRASQMQDEAARNQAIGQIRCPQRAAR